MKRRFPLILSLLARAGAGSAQHASAALPVLKPWQPLRQYL
jgi:hypothetical protein